MRVMKRRQSLAKSEDTWASDNLSELVERQGRDELVGETLIGGGHEQRTRERKRSAIDMPHNPARFLNEENSGGDVPRLDRGGVVGIEPSGCDIGEVQSGGSKPANRLRPHQDFEEAVNFERIAVDARRQADGDEGAIERLHFASGEACFAEECPPAALGPEVFAIHRIEHIAS